MNPLKSMQGGSTSTEPPCCFFTVTRNEQTKNEKKEKSVFPDAGLQVYKFKSTNTESNGSYLLFNVKSVRECECKLLEECLMTTIRSNMH